MHRILFVKFLETISLKTLMSIRSKFLKLSTTSIFLIRDALRKILELPSHCSIDYKPHKVALSAATHSHSRNHPNHHSHHQPPSHQGGGAIGGGGGGGGGGISQGISSQVSGASSLTSQTPFSLTA